MQRSVTLSLLAALLTLACSNEPPPASGDPAPPDAAPSPDAETFASPTRGAGGTVASWPRRGQSRVTYTTPARSPTSTGMRR